MENWQNVEKAINSANNSLGSADKSNSAYLDSIEGRAKTLTSTIQSFWNNFINADAIKNGISLINGFVVVLDKLINSSIGQGVVAISLLVGAYALLNKGIVAFGGSTLATTLGVIGLDIAQKGLLATTKILSAQILASPLFVPAMIIGGITAVIIAIDKFGDTLKNLNKRIDETKSVIQELQSEYDNLKAKDKLTDEQKLYLKLLEAEIDRKEKSLALDAEMLLQRQYLNKETRSGGGYTVEMSSGADKMKQSILQIENYKKHLQGISLENEKSKEQWDEIEKKILDAKDALGEQFKTLVETVNTIKEYNPDFMFADEIEDIITKSKEALGITDELTDSVDGLGNSFKNTSVMVSHYKDEVNSLAGDLENLEKAQDKINEGYTFSYSEIEDLKKQYPQLENAIYRTADGWKVEKNALDEVRSSMIEHTRAQIESEKENTQNTINEIKKRITARITEAKSLSLLAGTNASDVDEVSIMTAKQPKKPMDGRMSTILENMVIEKKNDIAKAKRELLPLETSMTELENLLAKLDEIGTGRVTGELKSKKPKEKNDRQFLESIDAEIRAIKLKNDNLIKTRDLLEEQLKLAQKDDTVEGLNKQYEITGQIIEHNKEILKSFQDEQEAVHLRAEDIRKQYSQYDTHSWFDSNGEQTEAFINQYNDAIKKGNKDQAEEMLKVFSLVQALKKAWMESGQEVNKIVDANKELVIQQDKLLDQQYELARTNWIKEQNEALKDRRDRLQSLESIQEAIVAIIRKRGEEEKRQLDENHKAEISSLEERHQERKKKYAEELDAFKKLIQDKINALDEQYSEEDYQEQLAKERSEATRLQGEIDVMSLDDSLTARNKTIELRKQLASQNEKIAKMQQNKERELLKKSLQDQLKDREDEAKDKEKIADSAYDNEKKRLEEDYKINKEFLDRKYEDDKVYAEAKESITRGTVEVAKGQFEDIYDAYQSFEDRFGKGMGILGNIIKEDFLVHLNKAKELLEDINKNGGVLTRPRDDYASDYQPTKEDGYNDPFANSKGDSGKLSSMSESDYEVYRNMKKLWENAKANNDEKFMEYASKRAQEIRKANGITSDNYSYAQLKDIPYDQLKVKGYDRGGKVDYTGLAMVHGEDSPEWMLRDHQLKKIISDSVLSTIKIAVPKIPNVVGRQGVVLDIGNLINIEGNATKDILPKIQKEGNNIINELQKLGNFRSIRI